MSEFNVLPLIVSDISEALSMLRGDFFEDEPTSQALGIGECRELEEFCTESIPENCSFKAVNSRGKMVGLVSNAVVQRPEPGAAPIKLADSCKHEEFKKTLGMLDFIGTQFSLFDLYPNIDKFLDLKIMSTEKEYRGKGIAKKLIERTIEYCRANSIPIISVLCTSAYSAAVCEKADLKRVYALNYADYIVDGENPILPSEPHKALQIMIKEVK